MAFYYVYVLQSEKNKDWLYVGYTEDLVERLKSHNEGKNTSTKPHRPFKLIFYEAYFGKKDAKRREGYLKTTKGRTTLRSMLKETLHTRS
jgi:predicted GIY-YIG superfamily endonuclease